MLVGGATWENFLPENGARASLPEYPPISRPKPGEQKGAPRLLFSPSTSLPCVSFPLITRPEEKDRCFFHFSYTILFCSKFSSVFFKVYQWLVTVHLLFSSCPDSEVCSCVASVAPGDKTIGHFTKVASQRRNWPKEMKCSNEMKSGNAGPQVNGGEIQIKHK